MKIIDINNKVFKSEEYLKDKYLFDVFEKKIIDENAKIMSDEENYIITNESEERAPWIRTKDNIDKSTLKEIEEVIKIYLVKDKMTFTCKKELYDNLLEDDFELIDRADYFELGFMLCEKLKETKSNDWWLDKAKPEERELIEKYVYNFETFIDDSVTNFSSKSIEEIKKECTEKAEEEMNNPNFYVLRNKDNKIVCMARYRISKNWTGTTWLVYTPDEERGKWYAAKIVHELTKKLLDEWYVPILYTDQNYPNSNKAYANTWYENKWMLVSFSCRKK